MSVTVYTDGCCLNNGQPGAKAGIGVFWGDGDARNVSEPVSGRKATNQVAEIQAVNRAIQQAKTAGIRNLHVITDSNYVIECVNTYFPTWRANGWRKTNGQPCDNLEELQLLDRLLRTSGVNVQLSHVEAHSGNYGNDMADRLAKAGAEKFRG